MAVNPTQVMENFEDVAEFYDQELRSRTEDDNYIWGKEPDEIVSSNFPWWDVSSRRFGKSNNDVDEYLIAPTALGAAMAGIGIQNRIPMSDSDDREQVKSELGAGLLDENGITDLYETPVDLLNFYEAAEQAGIPVYTSESFMDEASEFWTGNQNEVSEDGVEELFEEFVDSRTRLIDGSFEDGEIYRKFSGSSSNTSVVLYASGNDERFSEDQLDSINEASHGNLGYDTPFMATRWMEMN